MPTFAMNHMHIRKIGFSMLFLLFLNRDRNLIKTTFYPTNYKEIVT